MLLEIEGLRVAYNRIALGVHSVDLQVAAGEMAVVIGANGAGKTTTLRAVSGFLPSDRAAVIAGDVRFDGESILKMSPQKRVARGIALVPESQKVFTTLTVAENLALSASFGGRPDKAKLDLVYELFPHLDARRDVKAGLVSGGERQMLSIGAAMLLKPRLLLADEVSLGVAPILVTSILEALQKINAEQGTAVLLVEQNAQALGVADSTYVMESGSVKARHGRDDAVDTEEMINLYFGNQTTGDRASGEVQ